MIKSPPKSPWPGAGFNVTTLRVNLGGLPWGSDRATFIIKSMEKPQREKVC